MLNYDYGSNYDISPDGRHFYFVQIGKHGSESVKINMVLNWTDELRRKVPTGKN